MLETPVHRLARPCLAALLTACLVGGDSEADTAAPPEREGDDDGECLDGEDNDANGDVDCEDAGCAGAPECAPPTTFFDRVDIPGCDGSETTWWYYGETVGWTQGWGLVNAWETAAAGQAGPMWNEEHDVVVWSFETDPRRDTLAQDLEDDASPTDLQRNWTTVFTCGVHDQGASNTYVFRAYDESYNFSDCVVLDDSGTADGVSLVLAGVEAVNPVTRPEEITAANCTVW